MTQYRSPLGAALSSGSSFARGWAGMTFQLERQSMIKQQWKDDFEFKKAQANVQQEWQKTQFEFQKSQAINAQKNWQTSYDLNKKTTDQNLSIAKNEADYNWTQREAKEDLTRIQTSVAQMNLDNATWASTMQKQQQTETSEANKHLFGMVPFLLNLSSDEYAKGVMSAYGDTQAAFPNADMSKFLSVFTVMSNAKMFDRSESKLSSKSHDYVNKKGEQRTKYLDTKGEVIADFGKGELSDSVMTLRKEWVERLEKRREEMLNAFKEGRAAKFGGELSVAISDLNDISMNFHSIVGFADRLVSWLDNDTKTAKMRAEFDEALRPVLKDDKSRAQMVESIFGPIKSLRQEAEAATISRFAKAYADEVQREMGLDAETNGGAMGAQIYMRLLHKTEGAEREMHKAALMAGMQRVLSPAEYEEFLDHINNVAQMYISEQQQADQLEGFRELEQPPQDRTWPNVMPGNRPQERPAFEAWELSD